jgi:sugar phosphate isomerase/epimerase
MSSLDILAGTWTTAGAADAGSDDDRSPHDFRTRVETAARAGFTGVGIGYLDLLEAEKQYGHNGIRSMLADNGIAHFEIEMLLNWFVTDSRRTFADEQRATMFRAAEAIGARHVKVGGDWAGGEFDPDHMATEFRILCEDAANAGTKVAFEPMPFVNVRTPQQALEFIQAADHPAGGVLLDIWHIARAGLDVTSVASVPTRWIMDVELDDAPLHFNGTMDEMRADTFNGRRLPGQGELNVQGFVDAIKSTGYDGIWGVEILSAEYRKRPIEEAIPDAYRTTVQYLR